MKTIFCFATVIVVFTFFTQQVNAQPIGAYSIQDGAGAGFSPSVIELSGNRTLLISYSYFGNDSSFVKMVWLDQNMNVISHKEFRLVFALNYLFHAVKCPGGFLIGGLEYTTLGSRMYIVRTDTAGNVLRYDLCYYNPLWQEKIIQLIANNNGSFTGYSSVSNISDAMYRIDGNIADTLFHFKKITPVITNNYFRPLGATDIDGNGTHLLSGSMHDVAGNNRNAMLLKLDSNQVIWGKSYDYGQTFIEEAFNVIKLSNGNFAFVGDGVAGTGTYFDGYITVADATGENVWSRKLSITGGGVYPKTLVQTASGDILVFCSTHTYQGAILKFSEAGALLSSTIFTAPGGNTYFGNSIRRTDNTILASGVSGALMIMKLDDNGNGCSLITDSSIIVTPVTPVVTSISFTLTSDSVEFIGSNVHPRNLPTTSTQLCQLNGVKELQITEVATSVYPNPNSGDELIISSEIESGIIEICDNIGRKILTAKHQAPITKINIQQLPSGIYFVRLMGNRKTDVVKLVVE